MRNEIAKYLQRKEAYHTYLIIAKALFLLTLKALIVVYNRFQMMLFLFM